VKIRVVARLLALCCVAIPVISSSQNQTISPETMTTALDFVESTIRSAHVGSIEGLSPEFVKALSTARKDTRKPLTNIEFFFVLNEFFESVAGTGIRKIAVDLRGNTGGDSTVAFAFLEHFSDLELTFSTDRMIRPAADKGDEKTITPHVLIETTPAAIAAGTDPQLEYLKGIR
jgi:hypothetical protein